MKHLLDIRQFVALSIGLVSTCALARTVVLWPAVPDAITGSSSVLRNVAGPGDDLTMGPASLAAPTIGWNRPANLERGVSYADAKEIVSSASKRQAYSETAGRWMTLTNDFTVETFVKFDSIGLPNGSAIFNAFGADSFKWELNLKTANDGLSADLTLGSTSLLHITDLVSLTNGWHHLALTHSFEPTARKECFRLCYDGTLADGKFERTLSAEAAAHEYTDLGFDILTRINGWYIMPMRMFFVRISDEVLTASQLLNYGGSGTTVSREERTLAYWKLSKGSDGNIDGAPSVGLGRLNGGLAQLPGATTASPKPTMAAVPDCAFAVNPPNETVVLPEGNGGSWQAVDVNSSVYCHDVGPQLTLSSAFTVEGYIQPLRLVNDASAVGHVFLNAGETASWSLDFGKDASGWKFRVAAADAGGVLASSAVSEDLSAWSGEFKHVALVYDPAGGDSGFGLWKFYLNGVLAGSLENVRTPTAAAFGADAFTLGGGTDGFLGYYDCVRVSKAALPVSAFLCTAGGTAATNVMALWPLNRLAGEQPDGRDAAAGAYADGSYPIHLLNADLVLANKVGVHIVVTANDDAPTVTNPDRSTAFVGDPSVTTGSAQFYTVAKDRRYLMTADRSVCNALLDGDGYTVEGYFKRSQAASTAKQLLFGLAQTFAVSNVNGTAMQFEVIEKSDGIRLIARGQYANMKIDGYTSQEYLFAGTQGALELGVWHHLALTATTSKDGSNNYLTFELFVDGSSKGSIRAKFGTEYASGKGTAFLIGSYPTGDVCFGGAMSSLRISRGPLSASEFLCAAAPTPIVTTAAPLACWPLDADGAGLDGSSCIAGEALAVSEDIVSHAGRARTKVVSPWLDGTAWPTTRNVGSAAVGASGVLSSYQLGSSCELSAPFTVEGWLREAGNDGAVRRIVGVACTAKNCGWELQLDKTGVTPRLRVVAYDGNSTLIANGAFAFDATVLAADWTHLGLVYEQTSASNVNGSWTLYVNGKQVGSVSNARPVGQTTFGYAGYSIFSIGGANGTACAGAYDIWRLTRGALTADQLMYSARPGMAILIR